MRFSLKALCQYCYYLASSRSYWISLRRIPGTNRFNWSDGTLLMNDSFQKWNEEDPDNHGGSENCVIMGHPSFYTNLTRYSWFDVPCSGAISNIYPLPGILCQRSKGEMLTELFIKMN